MPEVLKVKVSLDLIVWEDGDEDMVIVSAVSSAGSLELARISGMPPNTKTGSYPIENNPVDFIKSVSPKLTIHFYKREENCMVDMRDVVKNNLQ